ncbi:D-glycero-beta-D-manno-heptose 1,7-bisphosphate 7-phosphatase [Chloroflexota bacterium]
MPAAIFLDRDGVIIENRSNYVRSWNDVHIFPQALDALIKIRSAPYKIIIVTNQSVIGRGLVPQEKIEHINNRLIGEIQKAGGRIDGVYLCPHAPEDSCVCRKPKPGLLLQAANDFSIEMDQSIMIGDALTDLTAGIAAGVKQVALLRTGRGAQQERSHQAAQMQPFPVYHDLTDALRHLI